MRTQAEVEGTIYRLFKEIGSNPADLTQITPKDGGWENALSYSVTNKDGKQITIYRKDLDDKNEQKIKSILGSFR